MKLAERANVEDNAVSQSTTTDGYDVTNRSVIQGDTLEVLPDLPENEFHAIVCDPPYNFEDGFMQQDWDDIGSPKEYQAWCQEWAEKALKTLKPGGHLIAFSGNRSHHRLTSGVEDAGYEIRDTITWHYGEGFPKGPRIKRWLDDEYKDQFGDWRGMLKPATEFAVLARAPFSESSSTKNQMEHGTGNLNVEACRLSLLDGENGLSYGSRDIGDGDKYHKQTGIKDNENSGFRDDIDGRFPPNLALDPVMAEVMDLQSGDVGGNTGAEGHGSTGDVMDDSGMADGEADADGYDDSGGASRFFYCSKAAKSERTHGGEVENDHPTVKPVDLMEWLVKLVTAERQKVLDPFAGSGTTLVAAENVVRECVGIEMDGDYVELAKQRLEETQS